MISTTAKNTMGGKNQNVGPFANIAREDENSKSEMSDTMDIDDNSHQIPTTCPSPNMPSVTPTISRVTASTSVNPVQPDPVSTNVKNLETLKFLESPSEPAKFGGSATQGQTASHLGLTKANKISPSEDMNPFADTSMITAANTCWAKVKIEPEDTHPEKKRRTDEITKEAQEFLDMFQ